LPSRQGHRWLMDRRLRYPGWILCAYLSWYQEIQSGISNDRLGDDGFPMYKTCAIYYASLACTYCGNYVHIVRNTALDCTHWRQHPHDLKRDRDALFWIISRMFSVLIFKSFIYGWRMFVCARPCTYYVSFMSKV
jgi:hypothetical protein